MSKNVRVYLYVEGFQENPLSLAERLGIVPDEVVTKGFLTPRKIIARRNSLELNSNLAETDNLDLHINGLLARIPDLKAFKSNLPTGCVLGVNTVIYIDAGEVSPRCGMGICKQTNRKLADLGCNLAFDIYG